MRQTRIKTYIKNDNAGLLYSLQRSVPQHVGLTIAWVSTA